MLGDCPWTGCRCPLYQPGVCEQEKWSSCVLVLLARLARSVEALQGQAVPEPGFPIEPGAGAAEDPGRVPDGPPDAGREMEALRQLTRREREVLRLLLEGERVRAISGQLHISVHTVRNHVRSLFRKLEVGSQVELVRRFGRMRNLL